MASLPPVRTREEAESDAEFVRGALLEAGRPDLAERVFVDEKSRGGWSYFTPAGLSVDDDRLIHRASWLRTREFWPSFPCFDCWVTGDPEFTLNCDHVLVAPRGTSGDTQ